MERGIGSWVETIDGERYLDYTCGIGVTNTGHAHPRVAAAIAEQAGKIIHAQQNILYHKPGLELHERLPRTFPGLRGRGGGRALPLELRGGGDRGVGQAGQVRHPAAGDHRLPRRLPRPHPRDDGAHQLGDQEPRPLRAAPGRRPLRAVSRTSLRNPTGQDADAAVAHSLAGIEELFATLIYPDDVAAFLVEPILGEGGYVVPPDSFLPALRELADRHGILLIADEVQSGMGRTGRMWATDWHDARPDIVVMAKGIASGMPLSGIMARRELLDRFAPGSHGGTYGGNAVACAAARGDARRDRVGGAARQRRAPGRAAAGRHPRGGRGAQLRRRGARARADDRDRVRAGAGADARDPTWPRRILHEAFERKLLLLSCGTYGQVVRVIPPLVTTDAEVETAIGVIAESLAAVGA